MNFLVYIYNDDDDKVYCKEKYDDDRYDIDKDDKDDCDVDNNEFIAHMYIIIYYM